MNSGSKKHFLVHIRMVNDTCMMGKYDQVQEVEELTKRGRREFVDIHLPSERKITLS